MHPIFLFALVCTVLEKSYLTVKYLFSISIFVRANAMIQWREEGSAAVAQGEVRG